MANMQTQVVVLGSGPGGYTAAYRAADLGKSVILVERYPDIGGVCLNVGCIPSKALLHAAKIIEEAEFISQHGIEFSKPKINNVKVRDWKNKVVNRLTGGLKMLAKQRKVEIVHGYGEFTGSNTLKVKGEKEETHIEFENAIIAVGSLPVKLPFIPEDPRIMDSTGALELEQIEGDLLAIGGGIIGCEMATVYRALGARIHMVELMDQLMPGADADIVKPLHKRFSKQFENIWLKTKVTKVEAKKDGIYVTMEGNKAPEKPMRFDRVLVSVGRVPNGAKIAAEKAGVKVTERGFIEVDKQMRTNVPHIFAIGDVVGNPMLAHKSVAEGRVAAEVIAGKKHYFEPKVIPSVAYTDPEIAWAGVTETQAKIEGIEYGKGVFPWAASGRSLAMGRDEGMTKILFNPKTNRVIGAGIVGSNAGDLISELALAIEMGCDAEDIALTIHPHPTVSETIAMATEVFEGTVTDLYIPKAKKKESAVS
ncbi:MAG: dihydrolipoyl dehydrogenase [Pseudomonadota bacterium]